LIRLFKWFSVGVIIGALSVIALFWLADTQFGHRMIANRIEALSPKSGLKIKIGSIDGTLYGKLSVTDLVLSDPQGIFLSSPQVALDWTPIDWFSNRLTIERAVAPMVQLRRLPRFNASTAGGPVLPSLDIHIAKFAIDALRIEKDIAGPARVGRASGKADLRRGRAFVSVDLDAREGDRLSFLLNADPDHDIFDLDAKIAAPRGGFIGAMIGTNAAVDVDFTGQGGWHSWGGRAALRRDNRRLADLNVTAREGRYGVEGSVMPAPLLSGLAQSLAMPAVRIKANFTLKDQSVDGTLLAQSPALFMNADGRIDLAHSAFDDVLIETRLLQPRMLLATLQGQTMRLSTRLTGAFSRPRFDYLLTAQKIVLGTTGFDDVRASGQSVWSLSPSRLPITLSARRITGVGDVAGGILGHITVKGLLSISPPIAAGDSLMLKSDQLSGKLAVRVDLRGGRYLVGLDGLLQRYEIPGLGQVEVQSALQAVPAANGRGVRVFGRGKAWVKRLDNRFLLGLAGGSPVLETAFERGPDGTLVLGGFTLTAPKMTLTGTGTRQPNGHFVIRGAGRQSTYGPFALALNGAIARPQLDIRLVAPNAALALKDVQLKLEPTIAGYGWTAVGGSRGGPFSANGQVLLAKGAASPIEIATINLSGVRGVGRLVPVPGGVDGDLSISGAGVNGVLELGMVRGVQRIRANVSARGAKLLGPPQMAATRADFDGDILLNPKGTTIDGTITGEDLQYGNIALERVAGNIKMVGGVGELRGSVAGARGRSFDVQTVARFDPNHIEMIATGTLDRRPIALNKPALLTRESGGWRLAPTALTFAGGEALVSGLFGATATELSGRMARMPMSVLDIVQPTLGLGGLANGSFSYAVPAKGSPTGQVDLTIRGLSRTGLILTSKPLDMGVTAILSGGKAGARLVALSEGKTLGRGQIQLHNIPINGDILSRLMEAPMFAQLRYAGAADTLWRLSGVENFDLSGDVAIGADFSGTMRTPNILGSLKTQNARVESVASGLVLSSVQAVGQFDGSRLNITQFSGKSGKEGQVSGTGRVEFVGAARGIDLTLDAERAPLLDRDDIAATVTGPIRIKSDGTSGVISGDVIMNRSFFRLGQASAAQVPRLNVREIGPRSDTRPLRQPGKPWRLDFKARAPRGLMVTGLGIDSEWQANLQIGGTIEGPVILGTANLVRGGYEFAGKRFDLARGAIRFEGTSPPDPVLDIMAVGDTQGINATIRVSGTGQRPEIAFASVPALPQDEVLSRLLFGTSITNLSAPEAVQLAAAVAALRNGGTGLNPINELRRAVGLDRLRILPADSATGQRTAIAAGKYLSRRTYVEIVTDGQGYTATRAEFQITRWLSILSTISTIGERSAKVRISKDY
jgi:translocation and assembly module TamB